MGGGDSNMVTAFRPWVIHTRYGEPYTVPEEEVAIMTEERVRIRATGADATAPAGMSAYQAALTLILNNGGASNLIEWAHRGGPLPPPWSNTWYVGEKPLPMASRIGGLPGAPTREDADLRGYLWVVEVPTETRVPRLFIINADTPAEALIRAGVERRDNYARPHVTKAEGCFEGDAANRNSIDPTVNKPLRVWAVSSNAWHASEAWLRTLAERQVPWVTYASVQALERGMVEAQSPTVRHAYAVNNDPEVQAAVDRGWLWLFEGGAAISLVNAPTLQEAWEQVMKGDGEPEAPITVSRVHACAFNATLTELATAPRQKVGCFSTPPTANYVEGIWQVPPPFATKRKDTYGITTASTSSTASTSATSSTSSKEPPMSTPATKSVHLSALADNATQGLIIGTTQEAIDLVQGLLAAQARKSSNPIVGGMMAEAIESRAGNVVIGLGVGVGLPFMMHLIPEGRPRRLAQTVSTVCQQQAFATGFRAVYQTVAKPLINHFVAAAASLPEEWSPPSEPAGLPEALRAAATEVVGEKVGKQ